MMPLVFSMCYGTLNKKHINNPHYYHHYSDEHGNCSSHHVDHIKVYARLISYTFSKHTEYAAVKSP